MLKQLEGIQQLTQAVGTLKGIRHTQDRAMNPTGEMDLYQIVPQSNQPRGPDNPPRHRYFIDSITK